MKRPSHLRLPLWFVLVVVSLSLVPLVLDFAGFELGERPVDGLLPQGHIHLPHLSLHHVTQGSLLHGLLEWTAFCLALATLFLPVVHYRIRRDRVTMVVCAGLFLAGILDSAHVFETLIHLEAAIGRADELAFSWALARTAGALLLLLVPFVLLSRFGRSMRRALIGVLAMGVLLGGGVILVLAVRVIPPALFPDGLVHRPWDLVPLVLYMAGALVLYRHFGTGPYSLFTQAVVLAAVPQAVAQLHMVFGSHHLFDCNFVAAHGLKILAMGVPLVVLAVDYSRTLEAQKRYLIEKDTERRERDRFFQLSNDILCIIDQEGVFLDVNQTWERVLGWSREQLIGTAARELIHPEDWERTLRQSLHVLQGSELESFENRYRTRGGDYRWLRWSCSPGTGGALYAVARDVTREKELERLKGEFVSVVSHELRTPLTSIHGALGMVATAIEEGEEVGPLLEIALRNSDRLAALVDDILDLERIRQGRLELRIELTDLGLLAQQSILECRPYAKRHEVELDLVLPERTVTAQVDPGRLHQVLTNLISNAVKFSSAADRVTVRVEAGPHGARLEVADEGCGIPEEDQSRVFEPFIQVDSSDTRGRQGTGLGLAICRAIVERMEGSIGVVSSPGEGSTFWVELPAACEMRALKAG